MYEDALRVLDYLPIRRSSLDEEYISHLWGSFDVLAKQDDNSVAAFSLTAFHLLFILSIQYKALRIFKERRAEYDKVFLIYPLRSDDLVIRSPNSVFDFGRLKEKTLFELLKIVGIEDGCLNQCKQIVNERNSGFMHASGNIHKNPSEHISLCLIQLDKIQERFISLNDAVSTSWRSELTIGDEYREFIEPRLYGSLLSRADFESGLLLKDFGDPMNAEPYASVFRQK